MTSVLKNSIENILSKSECMEIILNSLGSQWQLVEFNIKIASSDGVGFLGEYFKLNLIAKNLQSDETKQYSYFIKSVPILNEEHREIVNSLDVFQQEKTTYKEILKKIDKYSSVKFHAICYYARSNLVVLEDLFDAGFRHLKDGEILHKCHIRAVLRSIASMHAGSIAYEKISGACLINEHPFILNDIGIRRDETWFQTGLKSIYAVAGIHPKFQQIDCKNFILNKFWEKVDAVYDMAQTKTEYLNVFTHRDIWGSNIFFESKEINPMQTPLCALVDFQMGRYHVPAMDVILFLHFNIGKDEREIILNECLNYYYENLEIFLKAVGIDIRKLLSWNEFRETCNLVKLVALILNGIYIPMTNLQKEFMEIKHNDPKKYTYYINVSRDELIFKYISKKPSFKKNMFDAVEELIDYMMMSHNKETN